MKALLLFIVMLALCPFQGGLAQIRLDSGLVAYYPFNGIANDESGKGEHGTVVGATLTVDRFGNPNSAYFFDGSSYIKARADSLPSGARTTSLWFNAISLDTRPGLLGYGGNGFDVGENAGTTWFMTLDHYGFTSFCLGFHWGSYYLFYDYQQLPVSRWIHFVCTTDSAGCRTYVDGRLVSTNSYFAKNTFVNGRELALGVVVGPNGIAPYTDGNVGYFKGALDDIRIYNRAVSAEEVSALFSGSTVPIQKVVYAPGWNLVSVPRQLADSTVVAAFPRALSGTVNSFLNDEYVQPTTIHPGEGYWAFYANADTMQHVGTKFTSASMTIPRGNCWALVGALSDSVVATALTSTPSNAIVPGTLYGWNGTNYITPTVMEPGKGYWVLVNQPCLISMSAGN
jgi:hypothetical protein